MSDPLKQLLIPAEWAHHKAIWTAWPSHAELWQDDLAGARLEFAAMIAALSGGDTLKVLACGAEAVQSAQAAIGHLAQIIPADFGDIWLRDTGPIFATTGTGTVALRFCNNGWGGKYELPGDDTVGDKIAEAAGAEVRAFDAVLEGGALEHNGAGTILTTRQCLLNPNRNPGWTQALAESFLQKAFNCRRVLWLDEGLMNDHTDGHIDNLARFIAEDVVVCQSASGKDDSNAALYATIADELRAMQLTVHCIPSPGRYCNEEGDVMPASHMNFIIGNETVVVPTYDRKYGWAAVSALQKLFPDRKVVGVPSQYLLTGGGSFHCITQQEPTTPESRP
jgi:agmatine deiminase